MPDFSRVLCAVDLTEPSRRALDCALWWARRHGADVSVLHIHRLVIPPPETGTVPGDLTAGAPAVPVMDQAPLTADERQACQLDVERFVEQARTDGLQIEVLLDEDPSVADAIVARADALAADLVVVGAGTEPASDHPVLGRITADVLRAAPCSVLVIPTPGADVANPCVAGLTRIMCPVSLSDESRPLLASAAALATETGAHLTIVHVVELFSEVAALAYDFDAHREARVQPACDALVALIADVVGRDKPVEEVVAQGNASEEILKLAIEESTGLIVVGRGAGREGRGAGGPTAPAVACQARCPVLFLHQDVAAISRPFASDSRPEPRAAAR
ncbi:MAG TPA: universal stress protein [Vicinamibacterales bacterium]|jgi:nucleotide-binding universal stress UspA family protein|nr:universal stress protein [Vicinamibacterales bacterium]